MKKFVLSSLSLALIGAAGAAHAQSTVTLYGLIDAGLAYNSNAGGSHAFQATSGTVNGSRFGLKGQEDLGGGLKAVFTLENGFSVMNGALKQNSRMFGRQAFVGLSSNQYGTVTLGRQYDSLVDNLAPLSLTGTQNGGTMSAHVYDNDNLNNNQRFNNSVKYQSVDYAGFKLGAMYAFSNSTDFGDNRAYSVGASYQFGGLKAAAGYLQINGGGSSTNTSGASGSGTTDATFGAGRQRTYGAGLNYAFGAANVGLLFTQTQLNDATAISSATAGSTFNITSGSARFTNYEVNGRYNFTPAWSLSGAYVFTDARLNGASPKYHQVTVQTDYALSKRTDIYAEAAYQHVGSVGDSGVTAVIDGFSKSSTGSQVVTAVGIRTRF